MQHFKGTKGPWKAEESYMKGHTSVDAPAHGAIVQVLTKMDPDWSTRKEAHVEKEAELAANLRAVVCAPEMAEFLMELHFLSEATGVQSQRLSEIVAKLHGVQ